ncbi:hypothetical protein FOA43_000882 [Brettanomyces nanus]|uniref:Uncharacterized protein n=1 Tax=Eeniella nana TaxID=13502 RepID=A0A875RNF6_EENNA|nr:uncharacterized protein FOA43_000882 [Brettanomyces nanus]QPG73570.1 hypothetical protein FOA43_000882 [Brettanomyces nanus]
MQLLQALDDENESSNAIDEELKKNNLTSEIDYTSREERERPPPEKHSQLRMLQLKRDLLMERLQREEYLSTQFEDLLDRHQAILKIIKENLKNRINLEHHISAGYKASVKDSLTTYDENVNILSELSSQYKDDYNSTVEVVRKAAEQYNDQLNESS